MYLVHKNQNNPGKSNILFLPMTDLNPSDMSCIYSIYLVKFARNNNLPPIVTFDHPLFWKASIIIQKIILMLGSLHTFMNLLVAIGSLMSRSGIEDILKQIFADDATVHILTGKAVPRAFPGHSIVDTCLDSLLFSLLKTENIIDETKLEEICNAVDVLDPSTLDATMKHFILEMHYDIQELKEKLAKSSRTRKLWVEYQNMFYLASKLIEADRSGSWKMHLSAIQGC